MVLTRWTQIALRIKLSMPGLRGQGNKDADGGG